MTEVYDDDFEDDYDEVDEKPQRSDAEWAELRRAKKAREKAEKELADMKRQITFQKAGIDPDDPKFSYFVKGYDGELNAEAIRAEATKAGFLQQQAEPEPDQTPVDTQSRIAQAAGSGTDEAGLAQAALDQAFAEGGTEGMLAYLASQGVPLNTVQ